MTDLESRAPVLVAPEGWLVAEAATARLARQLAAAPADISGVAALSRPLPPGSSYRVEAERRATRAFSDVEDVEALTEPAAVLLRPAATYRMRDSLVVADRGRIRIDLGAGTHDPDRPPDPLRAAEPEGRPPFPRRPVVLLVACDPEPEPATLEWMRSLTNDLVLADVEARLACNRIPAGAHLTRPCLPVQESARALAPDVVIAADDAALAILPVWLRADPWPDVLVRVPSSTSILELTPARVGAADPRARGRIGGPVDATRLAEIARRLCAGPHPLPPGFDIEARRPPVWTQRPFRSPRPPAAACTVAALAPSETSAAARFAGFADHVGALGGHVVLATLGRDLPDEVRRADLVIARPASSDLALHELVEERARAELPTVIDLGPDVIGADAPLPDAAIADLVRRAARATTTSVAVRDAVRTLGARAQVLPVTLPRRRVLEARTLRRGRAVAPVVGWHLGTGATTPCFDTVAEALRELLDRRPDVTVHVVGDRDLAAVALSTDERVVAAAGGLAARSTWAAYLWTPAGAGFPEIDDEIELAETAALGVPAIWVDTPGPGGTPLLGGRDGLQHPDDTRDWFEAMWSLFDSPSVARRRSLDTARRADALLEPASATAIVNRFCGWARYR